MRFYRVTKIEYNCGDEIIPDTNFESSLDCEKKTLEEILNRHFSYGKRKDFLFVFSSIESAFLFLIKCTKGGNIYRVDVNPNDCFGKCDMNFIDGMYYLLRSVRNNAVPYKYAKSLLDSFANEYWNCGKTFLPCHEFLFKKAHCTKKVLSIDGNKQRELLAKYQSLGCDIFEMEEFAALFSSEYVEKQSFPLSIEPDIP